MFRGKNYIQNLDLCKLIFFSEHRNTTIQHNWVVFLPLLPATGANRRFLSSLPTFPLQSYSTGETAFPPAERREPWAEETKGSLSFPVILSSLLSCLYTLPGYHQFLSNNTWPQHEKVFEILTYIFIIMSIYHSALYK